MSSHLLASMVSDEKSVLNLTEETLYMKHGHFLFSLFPLCHSVLIIWLFCVSVSIFLSLFCLELVELLGYIYIFHQIWEIWGLYFFRYFAAPLVSPFGMPLVYIGMLYTGFSGSIHFYFFSICSSNWRISVALSSSLLIISSACSSLLFSPFNELKIFISVKFFLKCLAPNRGGKREGLCPFKSSN